MKIQYFYYVQSACVHFVLCLYVGLCTLCTLPVCMAHICDVIMMSEYGTRHPREPSAWGKGQVIILNMEYLEKYKTRNEKTIRKESDICLGHIDEFFVDVNDA